MAMMDKIETKTQPISWPQYGDRGGPKFTREFLEFVWEGVDGFVELAEEGWSRRLLTREEAVNEVEPCRDQYFSLLPRSTYGRRKADVVPSARLLWVDIDRLDDVDHALARVGVEPTFLYESGNKGYWAIWAIAEWVRTHDLEATLKAIAGVVGGDPSTAERSHLGRIPGSINRKSGNAGRIMSATWERHPWEAFAHIDASAATEQRLRSHRSGGAPRLEFMPRAHGSVAHAAS
jgi:hypothetical protein